ncbi:hypothetical protein SISNIDRAFT_170506 [Sistotremastrum niveocremeum HHB9708]|uniref:Uncharacterized protein n=1 Tax=Sistotremastrum niveocremeum HHB9708 TaxID=1314777 RepID=A0A164S345_9AGAM|nr:hypothetical protein SISNIDRAFT_170506 [Sistotremastrum niveocremeum HHB9708]
MLCSISSRLSSQTKRSNLPRFQLVCPDLSKPRGSWRERGGGDRRASDTSSRLSLSRRRHPAANRTNLSYTTAAVLSLTFRSRSNTTQREDAYCCITASHEPRIRQPLLVICLGTGRMRYSI